MAISDFNPEELLRKLPSLQVETSDGTIIPIPAGRVKIVGGANMAVRTVENQNVLIFETAEGSGSENPYYREKYEALANTPETGTVTGGNGTPEEPDWEFSAAARWVAALEGRQATAEDYNAFIIGNLCTTIGLFDQPAPGYPEGTSYQLSITDQCAPVTNLLALRKLLNYVKRLAEAYDYILSILDNTDPDNPPAPPTGLDPINAPGFLQQMQVMRHYWNYLVSRSTVKFGAQSSGQGVSFAFYFRNTSDQILGNPFDGMVVTVQMKVYRRTPGGALGAWSGLSASLTEFRPITRDSADDPPLQLLGYDQTFNVLPTQATVTFRTVESTPTVIHRMIPESELYCDGVILFKNMEDFDDGNEYVMRMTATIDTAGHMGVLSRSVDVYFTPPVDPGD